jgi:hypothetical protein
LRIAVPEEEVTVTAHFNTAPLEGNDSVKCAIDSRRHRGTVGLKDVHEET